MTKILFITYPAFGHIAPALAVADILLEEGHDVAWVTGGQVRYNLEELRNSGIKIYTSSSFDLSQKLIQDVEKGKLVVSEIFLNMRRIEQEISDSLHAIKDYVPDVIVTGETLGSNIAAEISQTPWAQITINSLAIPSVQFTNRDWTNPHKIKLFSWNLLLKLGGIFRKYYYWKLNFLRTKYGLPVYGTERWISGGSPAINIIPSIPEFEQLLPLMNNNHYYVGQLLRDKITGLSTPPWLDSLSNEQPLIYVTQGTSLVRPDLFRKTVKALHGSDFQIVMTTGFQMRDTKSLVSLKNPKILIEQWIPHNLILPLADAMIFPGGYNSSLGALYYGVPQVVTPFLPVDQFVNAERLKNLGVGIKLPLRKLTVRKIRNAVDELLLNPDFNNRACEISKRFREYGGAQEAAKLILDLMNENKGIKNEQQ